MEIWDGYWEDGSLANIDLVRGEPIPNGIYHMVCEILSSPYRRRLFANATGFQKVKFRRIL